VIRGRRTSQKLISFTEFLRTILKQVYLEIKAIPYRTNIPWALGPTEERQYPSIPLFELHRIQPRMLTMMLVHHVVDADA
jgi:hypothetical protein